MRARHPILLGSTYPLTLIRRKVTIEPAELESLRHALKEQPFASFWGHPNTLPVANALLGVDVTPQSERPVLTLTAEKLPTLDGLVFDVCYILSPDYAPGFRPQPGEEVTADKIVGWQVLRMSWDG